MHCEPNCARQLGQQFGRAIAAVFTDTLSAPARSSMSDIGHRAHPAADGERDEHLFGGAACTTSSMVDRPAEDAVTSRKVSSSAPAAS